MNLRQLIKDILSGDYIVAVEQLLELQPANSDGVVFPPTYPGPIKGSKTPQYCISRGEGWSRVTLDSVQSQANRIEPAFGAELAHLIPQHEVSYEMPVHNDETGETRKVSVKVNLVDMGHRIAGAEVRANRELYKAARAALLDYGQNGNPIPLIHLAPTSLLFGAWDSRGLTLDFKSIPEGQKAKIKRMLSSTIAGEGVRELQAGALYTPPVDYQALGVTAEGEVSDEDDSKSKGSMRGYSNAISNVKPFGGVHVERIQRQTRLNCVTLRKVLRGIKDYAERSTHGEYLLGLALAAVTLPQDYDLRQGCQLAPQAGANEDVWRVLRRNGLREDVEILHEEVVSFAQEAAKAVFPNGMEGGTHPADMKRVQKDKEIKSGKSK